MYQIKPPSDEKLDSILESFAFDTQSRFSIDIKLLIDKFLCFFSRQSFCHLFLAYVVEKRGGYEKVLIIMKEKKMFRFFISVVVHAIVVSKNRIDKNNL
jgi:hypothetical protein